MESSINFQDILADPIIKYTICSFTSIIRGIRKLIVVTNIATNKISYKIVSDTSEVETNNLSEAVMLYNLIGIPAGEINVGNKIIANFMKNTNNQSSYLSWDQLMPVISKCIICGMQCSEYIDQLHDSLMKQDIYYCWEACVKFINWYNICKKE